MKIKLLAFGQIAEITGEQTELAADVCDTTELLQLLYEKHPELKSKSFKLAINQKMAQDVTVLNENDTVALLPDRKSTRLNSSH